MRYFKDLKTAHSEVMRDLAEMGVKYTSATVQDQHVAEQTVELMNYGFTVTKPNVERDMDYAVSQGINKEWLKHEMYDRTHNAGNPGNAWGDNRDFWNQFLRDGCFSYTYSDRMHSQIGRVIYELIRRPNTRQAIITLYDQHQDMMNWGGRDRVPCSMHYQFMIRQGKLNLLYVMRSCDIMKFFLADYVLAVDLLKYISHNIAVKSLGSVTMVIGSLHAFESDVKGVF